jgi:arylsulfatase A-like enzyme
MGSEQGGLNFLFLMCDDLGYGDTGFNGSPVIQTPCLAHLEQLFFGTHSF